MRSSNTRARVEEGLLDGDAWWLPWVGLSFAFVAASTWFFIPELRSFWILLPAALLLVAAVSSYLAISLGNSSQRAAAVLAAVMVFGLTAYFGKHFFALELGQGVSSATSTTGSGGGN